MASSLRRLPEVQWALILSLRTRRVRAWSVQVTTNAKTHSFWLLNRKAKEAVSPTHFYALVNLIKRRDGETTEYFVIPSAVVAQRLVHDTSKAGTSEWWAIYRNKVAEYKDRWDLFS